MAHLILVRHPPVAKEWVGRCYGQSDMALSRPSRATLGSLVLQLAALGPDLIVHSGMRRTRVLAEMLGRHTGTEVVEDRQWRERDFGAWEGRTWKAIYRETGDAMDGMIDAPASFRPGNNGETTCEMIGRVRTALAALPRHGRIAIIAHGGPIAATRHLLEGTPVADLAQAIAPPATFVELMM